MPTLVINAPSYQTEKNSRQSFEQTLKSNVGKGYALNRNILPLAMKAKKVIILDKTTKRKATGLIDLIIATGEKTNNGIPRFNIVMSGLKVSDIYEPESLNRNGVSII